MNKERIEAIRNAAVGFDDLFTELDVMVAIPLLDYFEDSGLHIREVVSHHLEEHRGFRLFGPNEEGFDSNFPHCLVIALGVTDEQVNHVFDVKGYAAMVPRSSRYLKSEFLSRIEALL